MNKIISLFFITIFALLTFSCKKEIKPSWDTDYYGPIVKSKMNIQNLVKEEGVSFNDSSNLSFLFRDTIFSLKLDSSIKSSDTLNFKQIIMPIGLSVPPGNKLMESTHEGDIISDILKLKMADTDTAVIRVEFKSSINERIRLSYEIPTATKNGKSFKMTEDIEAAPQGDTLVIERDLYLVGYTFDLSGSNSNLFNKITSTTTIWIHPEADTAQLNSGDLIQVLTKLKRLDIRFIKGYLGSEKGNEFKESKFKLFNNVDTGFIRTDAFTAFMDIHNNIGMDMKFKVNSFKAVNRDIGVERPLYQSNLGRYINVSRASLSGNDINASKSQINLNPNNLSELFALKPDIFEFEFEYETNPYGNISMNNDFVHKDFGTDFILSLDVPLNISLRELTFNDILHLESKKLKNINNAKFDLIINNRYPFSFNIYLLLLDENENLLDSLNSNGINANAAIIGNNLMAEEEVKTISKINVPDSKISSIENAKYIDVKVVINTPDINNQYFLSNEDYIEVKLVGNINYKVNGQ